MSAALHTRWLRRRAPETFPESLSPAERRAVEQMLKVGEPFEAAQALGVGITTINSQLKAAREKAGARTTLHLVVKYLRATA